MTDCDRKDLKPEQARPNNNDIFRKRDLLHNRVKHIYRCQSGLLSRTKLTRVKHILPSFRQSELKYKIERKIKRRRNR